MDAYDQHGRVRKNPDGTYYSGDGFKVQYSVWTDANTAFDRVRVRYDGSVFEASGPSASPGGVWRFEIRKTASAGSRTVRFAACGTHTYTITYTDPETNETVTEVVHEQVIDSSSVTVEVVAYEPHFTVPLTYLILQAEGRTSFEKPFAIIARYDGNGPERRLDQRALIEGFTWMGCAAKAVYDEEVRGFVEATKPLQEFSSSPQPSVAWANKPQAPPLLQGEEKYVKLVVDLEDSVMHEVLSQNYTCVSLNVTFWSSRFTPKPIALFTANYTYLPETLAQPIIAKAYRQVGGQWAADSPVYVRAEFTPATNITTRAIYAEWFKNQTRDETALKMALQDIYGAEPQVFSGYGVVSGELLKTSPLLYNLTVMAEGHGRAAEVKRVVLVPFKEDETYMVYVNLLGGGVVVEVVHDSGQYACLRVVAEPEAGGLSRISVYDQKGRLMKTENVVVSPATQQGILGFCGEHTVVVMKSPDTGSRLTVEAENVWGAITSLTVEVEPYSRPPLTANLEELGCWLFLLIAAAIAFSHAAFFVKGRKT
jgi:hypothetical protein